MMVVTSNHPQPVLTEVQLSHKPIGCASKIFHPSNSVLLPCLDSNTEGFDSVQKEFAREQINV